MAVASGAPMKMGRVRWAPSVSCSSTTGVFDWRSTLTAASCISTMGPTLPAVQPFHMRVRVVPEGGKIAGDHAIEVAVALGEIEPVAENELVVDLESDVSHRCRHDAPDRLVQQRAHLQPAGPPVAQLAQDVGEGEAGVDDVLDQDDVAVADVGVEVFHDADPAGA